jgi:hypothetical protein
LSSEMAGGGASCGKGPMAHSSSLDCGCGHLLNAASPP